jgi:L-asparaginase/Glu-tRNA(Gln) amidotransferase subunit D
MGNNLHIFDFDDTLVRSDAQVIVTHKDGSVEELSSAAYAKYRARPGDKFDYSDFEKYPKGAELIPFTFKKFQEAIRKDGADSVVILTARANPTPVIQFLKDSGISGVTVEAVGDSNPMVKARYVMNRIKSDDVDLVHVYEDNASNVRAIRKVVDEVGQIKFQSTLIRH